MEMIRKKYESGIQVAFIGDIHAGLKGSNIEAAQKAFDLVATTDDMYLIGMGDYCEFRPPKHEFYDSEQCTMSLEEQLAWLFRQMEKCEGKIIGMLMGNHEKKICRDLTLNPIRMRCQESGIPFLGTMGRIEFIFPFGKYQYIVHHGYGSGRSKGRKVDMLRDFIKSHDVDAIVMGHVHQLLDWVETELYYKKGDVMHKYKVCGMSGTFLKTYEPGVSGYGEERMYEPTALGFLISEMREGSRWPLMKKYLF